MYVCSCCGLHEEESECIVLDVRGVLCNSFPLVAVMEGGQPDVEPQSSMPTRAPQVPDQVPLSTENTWEQLCLQSTKKKSCTYTMQ